MKFIYPMKGYQTMYNILEEINKIYKENDDFFYKQDYLLEVPIIKMGLKTLIDLTKTKETLQKYIDTALNANESFDKLLNSLGEVKKGKGEEVVSAINEGKLIIYIENNKYVIVEPVPKTLNRSIEQPSNENVLQGPLSSFIEDIETNIGLIRKENLSEQICVKSFSVGNKQKKKLSLIYYADHVDIEFLSKIKKQIETNVEKEVKHLQEVSKMLGFPSLVTVSKFHTTELPSEAIKYLLQGRVVLLLDRFPYALVLPNLLWDMFTVENDHNFPLPLMITIRAVRIIGVLATLLIPGLYVALVAVNPEVLRIEMALSVAQSRQGVPYPALVEIILMLIILELILEASVRLPKSIGPTVTMVGGIILGQAIVDAQLVSNLLIIILAATTIANFTIVGVQNSLSIRLFKYLIVLLAAIYGVLGILAGILFVAAYLASISTFGISYLNLTFKKDE
jgi:hypothetical protein